MPERRRMRVVHVLEAANHGTGTARHLLDLVAHATDVDHHVVLPRQATSRGEPVSTITADRLRRLGAHVTTAPMRRLVAHPDTARALAVLRRHVRRVQPAVVHGHSAVGGALARMAGGAPVVYTPNGIHPSGTARVVERMLARRTAAAIAVSRGEAELLASELGIPRARIHVVPNGIGAAEDEAGSPLPPLAVPQDAVVIGWIGRHAPQKAPEILVQAAAELLPSHPDVHLVMAGGGPLIRRTRALVEALPTRDRVHVLGFVPDARRLLPCFDVLALPSRWEGAPYVPLEAMAAGVPVVLSRCVGNADLVHHGKTGWVVDVDDPAGLAGALAEVLDDPDDARERARRARERVATEFGADRMAARTVAVYEAVVADRSVGSPT